MMVHGHGDGSLGRINEQDLLAKFIVGQRSLYDVRTYLERLRARGEIDRAARIERSIILE